MNDSAGAKPLEAIIHEAEALIERRRHAQARLVVGRGLETSPDNATLLYFGAIIDHAEGNIEAAERSVRDALRTAPEHYGARRLLAWLREESKDFGEAELLWIGLLRDYPEDAESFAGYAQLILNALDLEKAEQLAREGLRHEPEHAGCLFVLTMASLAIGRRGAGADAESLARLLRAHPDSNNASIALIVALSDRGDNAAALRVARQLLRAQPDSPQLLELVKALRRTSHWSMLPLYPMQRWGWTGAIVLTVGGIAMINMLSPRLPPPWGDVLRIGWIGYVIYSWVWPPLLNRLMR